MSVIVCKRKFPPLYGTQAKPLRQFRVRPILLDEKAELERHYRQTKDVRLRERLQMILLAADEIVLSRPQPKGTSPDPEYQVKKRRLKRTETT